MHRMHNFLEVDFLSNFDTPIFLKVDFFSDSDTSIFLLIHSDIWRIVDKGSLIDWIVGRYMEVRVHHQRGLELGVQHQRGPEVGVQY